MTIDEYVGQKLRDYREKVGLTLLDLSERVGVSHQQIHKYEIGQTKISMGALYKFCKIFSVNPNCFFEGFPFDEEDDGTLLGNDIAENRRFDKINVLLIEDNSEDQFLIRRALEEFESKINFYCFYDGEDFLNFIKRKVNITSIPIPDIIFMDLNMPKMSGGEILKSIKQNRELQYIPIIIVTGSISRQDIINAYKNFASGYIRKSFEFETFKKNLKTALEYWTEAVVLPHQAIL
ncbi:response regulator [Candidatus Bealeia paramacronuclearis]